MFKHYPDIERANPSNRNEAEGERERGREERWKIKSIRNREPINIEQWQNERVCEREGATAIETGVSSIHEEINKYTHARSFSLSLTHLKSTNESSDFRRLFRVCYDTPTKF